MNEHVQALGTKMTAMQSFAELQMSESPYINAYFPITAGHVQVGWGAGNKLTDLLDSASPMIYIYRSTSLTSVISAALFGWVRLLSLQSFIRWI